MSNVFERGARTFSRLLTPSQYSNAALAVDDDEAEPGVISVMQAEVVAELSLYMSKYEEEFQPFLAPTLGHVWELLIGTYIYIYIFIYIY